MRIILARTEDVATLLWAEENGGEGSRQVGLDEDLGHGVTPADYSVGVHEIEVLSGVLKYNPNHHPAGAPGGRGGQFAPKDGASAEQPDHFNMTDTTSEEFRWAHFKGGQATTKQIGYSHMAADDGTNDDLLEDGNSIDSKIARQHVAGILKGQGVDIVNDWTSGFPEDYRFTAGFHYDGQEGVLHLNISGSNKGSRIYDPTEADMMGGEAQPGTVFIHRVYTLGTSGPLAGHSAMMLPPELQGQGVAKPILKRAFDRYEQMGTEGVTLQANVSVGGYAWARMGFKPKTDEAWNELRENLKTRAMTLLATGELKRTYYRAAMDLLRKSDPEYLWDLADMRDGGTNIGKLLLMGSSWRGYFDMKNQKARERARRTTGAFSR